MQAGPEALGWPGCPWGWTSLPCRAASQEHPPISLPQGPATPHTSLTGGRGGAPAGRLDPPGSGRATAAYSSQSPWSHAWHGLRVQGIHLVPFGSLYQFPGGVFSPSPPASNPWASAGAWDVPSALTSRDQPCRMVPPPHTHVRPQSQGSVVTWASD